MQGKHTDDDGQLSVFASGSEVLIACDKGHYWLLSAEQKDVPKSASGVRNLKLDAALESSLMKFTERD